MSTDRFGFHAPMPWRLTEDEVAMATVRRMHEGQLWAAAERQGFTLAGDVTCVQAPFWLVDDDPDPFDPDEPRLVEIGEVLARIHFLGALGAAGPLPVPAGVWLRYEAPVVRTSAAAV